MLDPWIPDKNALKEHMNYIGPALNQLGRELLSFPFLLPGLERHACLYSLRYSKGVPGKCVHIVMGVFYSTVVHVASDNLVGLDVE